MRIKVWMSAAFVLVLVVGAGACQKYVTEPITRRPVISSVVAFPTVLGPGDSTMITIFATDPDGDSLVYDWEPSNGLTFVGQQPWRSAIYNTPSRSMVFYGPTTRPYPVDTAYVWCSARDQTGGGDQRRVLIFYKN